jgi:hypothetical protein
MISLTTFALEVFALTFIVGQAKISHPFRLWFSRTDFGGSIVGVWLLALIECNACAGTWLGGIAFFLRLTPAHLLSWWAAALYCCATSLILAKISGLDDP